jgi:hypothetical protein
MALRLLKAEVDVPTGCEDLLCGEPEVAMQWRARLAREKILKTGRFRIAELCGDVAGLVRQFLQRGDAR